MANKVMRIVQDKLNSLSTSQLERYGQELSGQLALVIFDKQYAIVEATFQQGVITFTSEDYKINKKIFEERQRAIGDKSIMFDVRHKAPPYNYEAWERVDLAFEGDYVLFYDEYARITDITENTFSIKTTETDKTYTFVIESKNNFIEFSDFLVEINSRPIRAVEDTPDEPEPERNPTEEGEHLLEFSDGEVDYVDRKDFCVIGDKVKTSYGDGQITDFNLELGHVFLKKLDSSLNFHCLANEVVELIDDQDEDQDQDQDDQDQDDQNKKICKSVELYEQMSKNFDTYLYPYRLFFEKDDDGIYKYYSILRSNSSFDMDANAFCFFDSGLPKAERDALIKIDEKIFKYLILRIKNTPLYFEQDGYEIFYFDKIGDLLATLSKTNKLATGMTDDYHFFLYAIGENRYKFYMSFQSKDETFDFQIANGRIISTDMKKSKCSYYELTLSNLLEGKYDIKEASETPIYKKMEIFINLVQP